MKIWSGSAERAQAFVDADSDLIRCEVASLWNLCLRPLNVQDSNGSEHTRPRRARATSAIHSLQEAYVVGVAAAGAASGRQSVANGSQATPACRFNQNVPAGKQAFASARNAARASR